jgi:hypothetical protein
LEKTAKMERAQVTLRNTCASFGKNIYLSRSPSLPIKVVHGLLYLGTFKIEINMDNITGLILTAIIAIIGVVKFKLIEELVKKITPDD